MPTLDTKRRNLRFALVMLAIFPVIGCSKLESPEFASLVVTGAKVWTGDTESPWAEAVASRGEIILAVGSQAEIAAYIGDDTEVISVPGSMLVPGFIDSHVHFLSGGSSIASVQLRDARSPEEFANRIGDFAKTLEPGEWIIRGIWDHKNWGGELPHRDWIDAGTAENPVWIERLDGHMGLANSRALEIAGVDADSPDIDGGVIERDESGRPTGVLKENAMRLMYAVVADHSEAELDRFLNAAMTYVASNGVTSVHDVFAEDFDSWLTLATHRRAEREGRLITRIYLATRLAEWQMLRDEIETNGSGTNWLKIGALKGFMDGSLGSHTAAFLEGFSDAPEERGFLINTLSDMRDWISGADGAGLQVAIHAIGDSAIRDLLDIYLDVDSANGARDRRFRIEHAQHIHPQDIPRFQIQNVIASMQPYHAIDDGQWATEVVGPERSKSTYAFRSLIQDGAQVAFGSDWYVAPATPLEGIYAAVTRRTLDDANPDGWVPDQKITVEEALRAYTYGGAYASFEEDLKGTLKPGMLADFVLIDRVLTEIPPAQIRDSKVLRTIVGGRVVYSAE
jgi:predicted amidohydrolase YtcJ